MELGVVAAMVAEACVVESSHVAVPLLVRGALHELDADDDKQNAAATLAWALCASLREPLTSQPELANWKDEFGPSAGVPPRENKVAQAYAARAATVLAVLAWVVKRLGGVWAGHADLTESLLTTLASWAAAGPLPDAGPVPWVSATHRNLAKQTLDAVESLSLIHI